MTSAFVASGTACDAAGDELAAPLWRALIDAMLDAVWLVDGATLCIVSANRAAGTLLGCAPADLAGRDVRDFACTPEDHCFWDEASRGIADAIESETLLTDTAGTLRAVTRRASPWPPAAGTADGDGGEPPAARCFIVVLHDRSAEVDTQRALEGTVAELGATLESSADAILTCDLAGRIRHFNRRFAALWRLPSPPLARRDDDAVLEWMRRSVADPSAYMRRLATLDDAVRVESVDVVRLRDGRLLERHSTPHCLRGRPIGRLYAFRDITDRPGTAVAVLPPATRPAPPTAD